MTDDDYRDAPVNVGDIIDIRINKLGNLGDGIGYVSGFVIIVPGTKVGDEVEVRIELVKSSFARAKVVGGDE